MFKKTNQDKKTITLNIKPELAKELKKTAKTVGITQRSLVEVAIKKILDEIKEHGVEL